MNYKAFYGQLYKPIEEKIGPIDVNTLVSIVGFDCGGPLNLCTVGYGQNAFVTYVSCELAVRESQQHGDTGPFEVMTTCDDERWARKVLTKIGQMSMESIFENGHTVDISQIVEPACKLKGVVIEEFACVRIEGDSYGIFRCHGVTTSELEFAMRFGTDELLDKLKRVGVYPNTSIHRDTIKLSK